LYDLAWKWESFGFSGFNRSGGTMPPSVSAEATATVSTAISSDKKYATGSGNVQVVFTTNCISGINMNVATFNKSVYDVFYSNM
jgi:hypothetical protein